MYHIVFYRCWMFSIGIHFIIRNYLMIFYSYFTISSMTIVLILFFTHWFTIFLWQISHHNMFLLLKYCLRMRVTAGSWLTWWQVCSMNRIQWNQSWHRIYATMLLSETGQSRCYCSFVFCELLWVRIRCCIRYRMANPILISMTWHPRIRQSD